jgi:hypothetical protein
LSGRGGGRERGNGGETRRVYACESNREFNFDLLHDRVTLIFKHGHCYNAYVTRRLGEKAKEHILAAAAAR